MAWGGYHSFPRAILHIDGDSFFASCEVAKNPSLRGLPVITGKERGIVSACTYEAKRLGIQRGMILSEVKKICPSAIILPSDYETYSLFSERMYKIVRRYTPAVEEYSIDECFADLTGMRRAHRMPYPEMARQIKSVLQAELGMTFSLGLSATKVLAKVGSKWQKPDGLTVIPLKDIRKYLEKLPLIKIWGVGPSTAAYLEKFGLKSAWDFAQRPEEWVKMTVAKPYFEIWHELQGTVMLELDVEGRESYQSISKTKTFTPPSTDPAFIYAQLSKNIENACIKARRWNLASPKIFFFLKTQDFRYHGSEITLPYPTAIPQDILKEVARYFRAIYKKGIPYRATGVALLNLTDSSKVQLDLFGKVEESRAVHHVFESVDHLSQKYGKHAVFLASSFEALRFGAHVGARGDAPERTRVLFRGETARRRLGLPMLGEVS